MFNISLEKRLSRRNMFRFYRLSILPSLFGERALAREWGLRDACF
ncbi:MAG: WGR domain-containing protein [Hyphomicrobiales bacterium]|nr:WGR domain-containing protein [Hyphomicrobiales bacterium]